MYQHVKRCLDANTPRFEKEGILKLIIQHTKAVVNSIWYLRTRWCNMWHWMAVSTNATLGFSKMHPGKVSFYRQGSFQKVVDCKLPQQRIRHGKGKTLNGRTNLPHGHREAVWWSAATTTHRIECKSPLLRVSINSRWCCGPQWI